MFYNVLKKSLNYKKKKKASCFSFSHIVMKQIENPQSRIKQTHTDTYTLKW